MQNLAARCEALGKELAAVKEELARERAAAALLRRIVTELSIDLDRARAQTRERADVTRLDSRRGRAGHDGQDELSP